MSDHKIDDLERCVIFNIVQVNFLLASLNMQDKYYWASAVLYV